MSFARRILDIVGSLFRGVAAPFRKPWQKKALAKSGFVEVWLEGEVVEIPPPESFPQQMVRRFLRRDDAPRVNLMRLRRFVSEVVDDPLVRGVLVQIGPLGGGWNSADQVRQQLVRLRDAGRDVLVHIKGSASNRELLVASGGTRLLMPPAGGITAAGAAAHGLFLKDPLSKLGVRVEAISKGRFKSGPDQFTRSERSEFDEIQSRAIVDTLDRALVEALAESRGLPKASAEAALNAAPMIAAHAKKAMLMDDLVRDEELGEEVRIAANLDEAPTMMGARSYTDYRQPIVQVVKKQIGVVEIHGAILDFAPEWGELSGRLAIEAQVVSSLRAALVDPMIHAVILLVNSPGGSVTASDAIYGAVQRLNQEKPVIACFSDVAASGGYYVACGAESIVASPLSITGSIGVYAMLPTWPDLAQTLGIGHDVIKNRKNASLYDPWTGLSEDDRDHAQTEIDASYRQFLQIVADARKKSTDEIHEVAEGRVWTGTDALNHGLVDGLGGFEEAFERAKDAVDGKVDSIPVLVHAHRSMERPPPFTGPAKAARLRAGGRLPGPHPSLMAPWMSWLANHPEGKIALETLALLAGPHRGLRILAHCPWRFD